eukprot:gene13049-3818_t
MSGSQEWSFGKDDQNEAVSDVLKALHMNTPDSTRKTSGAMYRQHQDSPPDASGWTVPPAFFYDGTTATPPPTWGKHDQPQHSQNYYDEFK